MSFQSQLNVQAKVLGYASSFEALTTTHRAIVYQAYLDNERNHQLQRIADRLENEALNVYVKPG